MSSIWLHQSFIYFDLVIMNPTFFFCAGGLEEILLLSLPCIVSNQMEFAFYNPTFWLLGVKHLFQLLRQIDTGGWEGQELFQSDTVQSDTSNYILFARVLSRMYRCIFHQFIQHMISFLDFQKNLRKSDKSRKL